MTSLQTYAVGTHSKRLAEALLMITYSICFRREIKKKKYGSRMSYLELYLVFNGLSLFIVCSNVHCVPEDK